MLRYLALGLVLTSGMTVGSVDAFAAQPVEATSVASLSAQNLTPEQIQAIVKLAVDGKTTVMIDGQSVTVSLSNTGTLTVTMANGTSLSGQVTKQANGAIAVANVQATSLTGSKTTIMVPVLAAGYTIPATVAVSAPGSSTNVVQNSSTQGSTESTESIADDAGTATTDASPTGGDSTGASAASGFGSGNSGSGGGQVGNPSTPSPN